MKDDLVALCEERGRKVNELADLLAKQLGRHPPSREPSRKSNSSSTIGRRRRFANHILSLERNCSNS
jgi:hypothetical protein